MGNAAKAASALLVQIPFVAGIKYALCLLADEGNRHRHRGGAGTWAFFLYRSLKGWTGPLPLSFLLRNECDHEIHGTDLAANDIFYIQVHLEVAEDPLQAYLLFELILNNRVNIHVSHMCLVQLSLHLLIVEAEEIVSSL
jgi:hypothetical protein